MNADTLAEALEDACNRWPERHAVRFAEHQMTYAQLANAIMSLAGAYGQLGVRQGDRIVCQLPNGPEHIVAVAAAWKCAAVHVGADQQLTGPELSELIGLTGAKVLLYAPVDESPDPFLPLRVVQKRHPDICIIVAGDWAVLENCLILSEIMGSVGATDFHDHVPTNNPSPQDPAAIFTTSGTTGKPKTPLGYHGKLCQSWSRLAKELEFRPDDVHLAHLPLAHGFGLMLATAALITGGRLVLLDRFSAEEALQVVDSERVTVLNGSAAHFRLLINCPDRVRHNISSLRIGVGSGASFLPSLIRSIFNDLEMEFLLMYGSSEGVGVVTTNREDMLQGSVGRPARGSVAIVGPDRNPIPRGEIGEIAFSRTAFPVRYWDESDTELLAGARQGETSSGSGWYYSGDLGRLDEEGRLYVVGRLKHQINRGGLKVDPVEVEGALLGCPGVSDAAVIGAPNPVLGETVCACVVPTPEQVPSLEHLRSVLSGTLAPYKLPEELCVLDRIPRTRLGKVNLEDLRAEVMTSSKQRIRNS
jgi:acyl-CoA synthetase (AMP-forming)/AMP-acid ligase II